MTDRGLDVEHAVQRLGEDGYVILPGVMSAGEVARYQAEAYRLHADDQQAAARQQRQNDADFKMYSEYGDHIFNLARKTRVFDALYEHPVVVSILQAVMKNKFILTQTEMRRPRPNVRSGSANRFHRDARIITDTHLWVTAFWTLEDVTPTNGPTVVLPGSHRRKTAAEDETGAGVTLLSRAGDLTLMDSNLLHKASESLDGSSRWILIFTYNQWFLKPTVDHTRYFTLAQVDAMSPALREMFGFTSIPPSDERKRMYTCRPWEEIRDEFDRT